MAAESYLDRDLSWLSFNERVLMEAAREDVPLLERFNFLSIYSSNLDEFYRVRMPALLALNKLYRKGNIGKEAARKHRDIATEAESVIRSQQERFGAILRQLIPGLAAEGIDFLYGRPLPPEVLPQAAYYFYTQVLAFLQPVYIGRKEVPFFPENNSLYLAIVAGPEDAGELIILNIPAGPLPRFYKVVCGERQYILFLDDIIKAHIGRMFPDRIIRGCYSFKVTRDAELNLEEVYAGDVAEKIEKQIQKRDLGLATRLLYEPGFPPEPLKAMAERMSMEQAAIIEGGPYHNLKDLNSLPVDLPALKYRPWPAVQLSIDGYHSLFDLISQQDVLLHTPYQSYDAVLRFFNEAAIDPEVTEVCTTMYRVAADSRIVNALISAAVNGKRVTVLIELKARFDEANNLKWAKRLKSAGARVLYTEDNLKVHAKIALVKRREGAVSTYLGLLSTGNMNESTARFYTDHTLFTAHHEMLTEVDRLFLYLERKEKGKGKGDFKHLLVAQFNLQEQFLELMDREIRHARNGRPARITIKLNNLEERVMIKKLYEASKAGVQVELIVRSICCLIPGRAGMSENITVRRIVDRYLEHGRVFIFHNNGNEEVYLGSADWMNRNIYKRIEVCFPVYNAGLREELKEIIRLQLQDRAQAVLLDGSLSNVPMDDDGAPPAQEAIYKRLSEKNATW